MIKKLILTDVYIQFDISGVLAADIVDIQIAIKNVSSGVSVDYTLMAGDIVLSDTTAILHIEDTDIDTVGVYEVRMVSVMSTGDRLGMDLDKENILFI
mgnify:CR=1 FL=1